jgi:glycosyltransferase involved in cell wall biosynthesis
MISQHKRERLHVAFLWSGLPDYGARQLRAFIDSCDSEVSVIATKPKVPIAGMEKSLGQKIHWLDDSEQSVTWPTLGLGIPAIIFQGGWAKPQFNLLASAARNKGARVILMNDQDWTGGFVQRFVDPLRHRLKYLHRFDGALTTGQLGTRYCTAMGFPPARVLHGLYGSDPSLFKNGAALQQREKKLLFIGQLVERKNVLALARAFLRLANDFPEWILQICGSGVLKDQLPVHRSIQTQDFVQPTQLTHILRESRCLVLPSFVEHWGLVVHEATLSGCALALSKTIGSRMDLASHQNAVFFSPHNEREIENSLREILSWNDLQWQGAQEQSLRLAASFGPRVFAESVQKLIDLTLARELI